MTNPVERFDRQTRSILGERLSLIPVSLSPEFRSIRPWRALGLVKLEASLFRSERLDSISLINISLAGLVRIYNMVFRPKPVYNLPILTSDVMFTGNRRAFYVEVIDPTGLNDDNKSAGYRRMMELKKQTAGFEQREAFSDWYRQVLADCSVMTYTDSRNDELLLEIQRAFINVYLDMVANAVELPGDQAEQVKRSMLGFIDRLNREGGSSVKMMRFLLGERKGREYVTGVVFGVGST